MAELNRLGVIERKRCDVPCDFRDEISRDEFSAIALDAYGKL